MIKHYVIGIQEKQDIRCHVQWQSRASGGAADILANHTVDTTELPVDNTIKGDRTNDVNHASHQRSP
jgi:hypothetical protein